VLYLISVGFGLAVGAAVGALAGALIQQITSQEGWATVVGALGANAGAFWAAFQRADGRTAWRLPSRRETRTQDSA
jgi:hypothetical protein